MGMGAEFVILGLENQSHVHYAMPLRILLYDGLNYFKEYSQIAKNNKREKRISNTEFLSGFKKTDRLHPVFTIVVYYSEIPWDGPKCLKDIMLPMAPELECYFNDYSLNLLQICDASSYIFHHPDVNAVFDLIHMIHQNDFAKIREKYESQELDSDVLDVVQAVTSLKLPKISDCQKGRVNMWKSVKEWEDKIYKSGETSGNKTAQQIITRRMLENQLDVELIHKVTELPIAEIEAIKKTLTL